MTDSDALITHRGLGRRKISHVALEMTVEVIYPSVITQDKLRERS
jgi:hypothetical protein